MAKQPKIRVCKNCNNPLPEKATVCPSCGAKNKKPIYICYDKLVIKYIMTSKYLWKEKSSCLYNYGFLYSFSLHNNRYFLM